MTGLLYALPEVLLVALSACLLATAVVTLPPLVQRVWFLAPTDPGFEFIIRMQAPLFTMTALVLTFTLVEAERNFRQVDSNVTTEASQLSQLDRLLTRADDPAMAAVRPLLRAYAQSIVKDEWPDMLHNRDTERTSQAFTALSRAVFALDPKPGRQALIYTEILKSLDVIAESRERRLDSVKVKLPGIYWIVILFSVLMVLLVSCTIQRTPFRMAVLAAQLSVLGAFVGFVFIMDAPFQGESAIGPDAITQALAAMDKRVK